MTAEFGRGAILRFRRGSARIALSTLLLPPAVAAAQPIQLLPPAMSPAEAASPVPIPVVPAPPPVALPRLSDAQARQLAGLLASNAATQGLQESVTPLPAGLSNDALARAALDQARAVRTGRLDQSDFLREWGIKPPVYDPLPAFADAVMRDRLAAWIATLPPPYAGYDALVAGLARYRRLAAAGGWPVLAAAPELKYGASGPTVAALRKRLAIEDPQIDPAGNSFDDNLLEAVRRAQRRYGLNPQGTVGAQTLAALNVPVQARIRQIMANMERWRWLPPELSKDRIQVNIAAAVLTVFDGDAPVTSMKAVTGRPGDETPMLVSEIHSIVINPPWNVPSTIAARELWPKERAHPGYFKRNGFRVIDTGDGGSRLQQSSERSALGHFKFDFDNAFAVYLHDTPAQSGFARFDRLSSHGCVRLEKPADLARLLLKDTPEWPPQAIDDAVKAGKTVRAHMAQPVAVYLLYWTAFASPNGLMAFRDDPYSWDAVLATRIEGRSANKTLAAR
jgi:murein L,D-transpeptidase YcbB/YkuD